MTHIKKIDEMVSVKNANGKNAYLVTFEITTRVVSDVNLEKTHNDTAIVEDAIEKIKKSVDSYVIGDNVTDVVYDEDMPYDPNTDDAHLT